MPTKEFFAERTCAWGLKRSGNPRGETIVLLQARSKQTGVRCAFVVRYPALIEAPWISGGRAEVNERGCRYGSDHTARKGELRALLIGAHAGSQTMRYETLPDIPADDARR